MPICPHCLKDTAKPPEFELTGDEPQTLSQLLESRAAEIYNAYPRKVGRGAALKKIKLALSSVPFKELLAATQAFAQLWQHRPKPEWKFCPHPATWYSQERWADVDVADPEPAPADVTDEIAAFFS